MSFGLRDGPFIGRRLALHAQRKAGERCGAGIEPTARSVGDSIPSLGHTTGVSGFQVCERVVRARGI